MENRSNIVQLFCAAAEQFPAKIAIVDRDGRSVSYSQLQSEVAFAAARFLRKGVLPGDRVLVFVPMGIALYRTVLALFSIGATVVFVDQWSDITRLNACCRKAGCQAFVGHWKAHLLRFVSKEIRRIPLKLGLSFRENGGKKPIEVDVNEPALITFTTGSTGEPKAPVRSHHVLHEQFRAIREELNAKPDDVDMAVLPVVLLINLALGSTSVIADFNPSKPTKLQVSRIVDQLVKYEVTRLVASPYFVKRLALHVTEHKMRLPSLRAVFSGGAPVFQQEAKIYIDAFAGKDVRIIYGSTEAEPISSICANELINRRPDPEGGQGLPVGFPYHGTDVRIIRMTDDEFFDMEQDEFARLQQPERVWGEIIVAGNHVLAAYHHDDTALRANKIKVGGTYWHRTGDSGYLQNGQLYLTGRSQTLIAYAGGWISPFLFENDAQTVDVIEMGTVLQVGSGIHAFIELKNDSPTNRSLTREWLSNVPYPIAEIRFVKIPRDPRHHSKIAYSELQALGWKLALCLLVFGQVLFHSLI